MGHPHTGEGIHPASAVRGHDPLLHHADVKQRVPIEHKRLELGGSLSLNFVGKCCPREEDAHQGEDELELHGFPPVGLSATEE